MIPARLEPGPRSLVESLVLAGDLTDPAWREAFLAVRRDIFVPGYDLAGAYNADRALVVKTRTTQSGLGVRVSVPTSSASAPSVMALMLELLRVREGMRVLEIGTGTGYNAALLCHRLGDDRVYSVDIDPDLVASAERATGIAGHAPHLAVADGYQGLPSAAPFDRIIATCAITRIPPPWIRQLAPGGRIVAPMLAEGGPLVVLDKTADAEVTGRIDPCPVVFMPLREDVDNPMAAGRQLDYVPQGAGHRGTTDLDPRKVMDAGAECRLFLALHLTGLAIDVVRDRWAESVVIASPHGYAEADLAWGADRRWEVTQYGTRLWDIAEHALREWPRLGRPHRERYGVSAGVEPDTQFVWLDDRSEGPRWPLPV